MNRLSRLAWLAAVFIAVPAQSLEMLVKLTPEQAQHIGVRTLKPEMTRLEPLVRAPARVELPPHDEFLVSAPQPGFVGKVEVALGVNIRQGQVLAQIRSPELVGLQHTVLDAANALHLAETKLIRDRTLLAEGIIASIRYQETKSDHDRLAMALREAEQMLATAGFRDSEIRELKRSRRLNNELPVRSPIDGVLLERFVVTGQRVDLLAPLFRVGKLEQLWLEVDVPMERLGEVQLGDGVDIIGTGLSARITHIGRSVNPGNQSALVRAVIKGQTEQVKPGQHVNVQLMHASTDELFRLPAAALFTHEGQDYVFVRAPQGFDAREVAVASRDDRVILIHAGLKPGEEVAVQGVAALKATWVGVGADE